MKAKVTKVNSDGLGGGDITLTGKFKGKETQLYITSSNTSWWRYKGYTMREGDEVEIDDSNVKISNKGNHYLDHNTKDTAEKRISMLEIMKRAEVLNNG